MSRPTIAGVARAAGVSVASVSRVLNGLPATEEMVERVQRAVSELGYVPDARARSLKVGRTSLIRALRANSTAITGGWPLIWARRPALSER